MKYFPSVGLFMARNVSQPACASGEVLAVAEQVLNAIHDVEDNVTDIRDEARPNIHHCWVHTMLNPLAMPIILSCLPSSHLLHRRGPPHTKRQYPRYALQVFAIDRSFLTYRIMQLHLNNFYIVATVHLLAVDWAFMISPGFYLPALVASTYPVLHSNFRFCFRNARVMTVMTYWPLRARFSGWAYGSLL